MTNRQKIAELCSQAGVSPKLISEIAEGCDLHRCNRILLREMESMQPGTLTHSDPSAIGTAYRIAVSLYSQQGRDVGNLDVEADNTVAGWLRQGE